MSHANPWNPPAEALAQAVKTYPHFPVAGVMFKDIWPLLADPVLFRMLLDELVSGAGAFAPLTHVAGIESRGFILAHAVAQELRLPFVPIRKPGKLPGQVEHCACTLEYGQTALEMQVGAMPPASRCLLVDDVLATGGTALAAAKLIRKLHAVPAGLLVVGEVTALGGRQLVMREAHLPAHAVMSF